MRIQLDHLPRCLFTSCYTVIRPSEFARFLQLRCYVLQPVCSQTTCGASRLLLDGLARNQILLLCTRLSALQPPQQLAMDNVKDAADKAASVVDKGVSGAVQVATHTAQDLLVRGTEIWDTAKVGP